MANPFHRSKLCEGALAWNLWRDSNPHITPDLERVTLASNQRQFGLADWGPIDLRRVRLSGADLANACLTAADLEEAILSEVTLTGAKLDRANLSRANLAYAILDDADLDGARLDSAVVNGARLHLARNLTQSQIDRCLGDRSTALPAGIERPTSWLRREGANAADLNVPGGPPGSASALTKDALLERQATEEISKIMARGREALKLGSTSASRASPAPDVLASAPRAPINRGRKIAVVVASALAAAATALLVWTQWLAPQQEKLDAARGAIASQAFKGFTPWF